MTLVSIVTPALDAMPYLREAVASVRAQSLRDWELIVVDDGSTDGTGAWLDTLSDPRIRVVHQANRGVGAARNVALDMARGEFITFLDGDDALPPDSLKVRVERLQAAPHVDIVDGRVQVCNSTLERAVQYRMPGNDGLFLPRLLQLDDRVFFNVAYMVRRSAIGPLRFREDMTHCEDILFFAELSDRPQFLYGVVEADIYRYRRTGTSAMANLDGLETGYLQLIARSRALTHAKPGDLAAMQRRVRRILFRSWMRRGRPLRALHAVWQLISLPEMPGVG